MAKPVVFVIGASGKVGTATVRALAESYSTQVEIRAGTRKPDTTHLRDIPGVTVVYAEMGKKEELVDTLRGVHALYIVTPSGENRDSLTISTAEAAKEAGVTRVLVVSVLGAALSDTILGKQFGKIENAISTLGIPFTILRVPYFIDDMKITFKTSIKERAEFSSAVEGTKTLTGAVVADIGKVSATILCEPTEKHASKTYKVISDRFTFDDVAKAFSEALEKEVTYKYEPFNRQAKLTLGIPERAVNIMEQLSSLLNSGCTVYSDPELDHYQCITGQEPTSLKSWVFQEKTFFK